MQGLIYSVQSAHQREQMCGGTQDQYLTFWVYTVYWRLWVWEGKPTPKCKILSSADSLMPVQDVSCQSITPFLLAWRVVILTLQDGVFKAGVCQPGRVRQQSGSGAINIRRLASKQHDPRGIRPPIRWHVWFKLSEWNLSVLLVITCFHVHDYHN